MISVIFPGQGSQYIGMAKEIYDNFAYVRDYFSTADELLKKNISKIILEGPKEILDQTENTQPAIFLTSYSIFKVLEKESDFKVKSANFFAGHSLGEYTALCSAGAIDFNQTIRLLDHRGKAMQNAVPKGEGGMVAILGLNANEISEIINDNNNKLECYIANDNSIGQIVISGRLASLDKLEERLKKMNIKSIRLPVSAPFHCPLMNKATIQMMKMIEETKFDDPAVNIVSNVNAKPYNRADEIKNLLIEQIEKPVRWRESVENMINLGVNSFIEIGPGKVLSGLIKRIDRKVKLNQINNLLDITNITND